MSKVRLQANVNEGGPLPFRHPNRIRERAREYAILRRRVSNASLQSMVHILIGDVLMLLGPEWADAPVEEET